MIESTEPDADVIVKSPEDVKKLAELGILRALPKLKLENIEGGRLLGRMMKLEKVTTQEIRGIKNSQKLFLMHKPIILELLETFQSMSGWLDPNIHLVGGACFCLKLVQESKFEYSPMIEGTLVDIIEYYGREGIVPDEKDEERFKWVSEAWNAIEIAPSGRVISEYFERDEEDGG